MNILLVKMSSLGDIVHTLPALDDARRHGVRFDWVVEENYRAVPALAPGVDRVLEVGFRRWRRAPITFRSELGAFRRRLRARRYDKVLDAQGLLKSAVVGCWANAAERVGFNAASARERAATLAYHRGISVPRDWHAIDRTRRLLADALGYDLPDGEPAFGLGVVPADEGTCPDNAVVLAHGTTWRTKHWPEPFWSALARFAAQGGFVPVLPWVLGERGRAERIAATVPGARVCPPMDLDAVMQLLAVCRGIVGVDSGLAHLGAAMGRPTVMLFGPSDPALTGCRGRFVRNLAASWACAPCVSKRCRLTSQAREQRQASRWAPPCLEAVGPDSAWVALTDLIARKRLNDAGS
ncbi:MAG: lipopolysaccharide heptosyltransferase I [Gammaproteobacteria bacterium]|nr:lipopolysaccharide heptosyltransferase I [Gammaproteobacteria bacterium]